MTPQQILDQLDKVRYGLSVEQTRLIECATAVRTLLDANQLTAPPAHVCPECGATHRGPNTLAEHRYHVHNGAVPEHYLAAERAASL